MKLIDNASGNVSQGITLSSENKADRYKLSYNCNHIGSGKSYIRIYATVTAGYKTYFMPVQFGGRVEFEFSIDSEATLLQFDVVGDAILTGITLETVVDAAMQYVKENAGYWDRIKEITSNTGKVRTDMLEGLINMTVNAFANESGTITQKNGIMTFLNGTTVGNSTQAVQISGGGIRVANSKLANGEWNWTTAISGAGINAATIIAETFNALEVNGLKINGGSMTTGTLTGCSIIGGELYIGENPPQNGDTSSYTGMVITRRGVIDGYINGNISYTLSHNSEGRLILRSNNKTLYMDSANTRIYSTGAPLELMGGVPSYDGNGFMENSQIIIEESNGDIYISADRGRGTVHIVGDLEVGGTIIN